MNMHVFVETNWVIDYAAPEFYRSPEALRLFERARRGELRLYIPSISLTEARHTIPRKYQGRREADKIRYFLRWATSQGRVTPVRAEETRALLDRFEAEHKRAVDQLSSRLNELHQCENVEIFALDEEMIERAAELSTSEVYLEPFDQAILAAILVRARRLLASGEQNISFCELDKALQCWDSKGDPKNPLKRWYDDARIWVYEDFTLASPSRPDDWAR